MEKLTLKSNLGYGVASLGDAAAYQMIVTYLLFFLTTVAGIAPAMAGTITAVGSLWNTIYNPIMGYISDHTATRWGKRRVFMFIHVLPLAGTLFLLFTNIDLPPVIKPIYYGIILLLFWSSYTGFFIPYFAMGAEYTNDYDERTSLRSFAALFNMLGSAISMVLPTLIVDRLGRIGISEGTAWSIVGVFIGFCTLITILITAFAAKTKDKASPRSTSKINLRLSFSDIFSEYWQVLKLKPLAYLLFTSLFFLIAYSIFMANIVCYLTYVQKLNATFISGMLLYRNAIGLLLLPIGGLLCRLTDKKKALGIMLATGAAAVTVFRFTGVDGIFQLGVFLAFVALATAVYWQLMPAIIYDVCEYDELVTGKKRQGTILSIQGLVEALSAGIGAQILGIVLQFAGFDGHMDVQTESALAGIENCMTVLPAVFILLAILALLKYPITKKRFLEIQKELKERRG